MCCAAYEYDETEVNGECQDCGGPTINGEAADGCYYSPVSCDTCGYKGCDGSC